MKKFIYRITKPFRGLGLTRVPIFSLFIAAIDRYFKSGNPEFVKIGGFGFHLDQSDSLQLSITGTHEPEVTALLNQYLTKDMTFIDIGANIGYHSVFASRMAKEVISFEPEPNNYGILKKNLEENNCSNVVAHRIALMDKKGFATLNLATWNKGGHSIAMKGKGYGGNIKVPADTLDNILHGGRVDFIKMDVEGAEGLVLRGMAETLAKWRPIVVSEFMSDAILKTGVPPEEFFTTFKRLGYIRKEIGTHDKTGDGAMRNYLFLPS